MLTTITQLLLLFRLIQANHDFCRAHVPPSEAYRLTCMKNGAEMDVPTVVFISRNGTEQIRNIPDVCNCRNATLIGQPLALHATQRP